jgi:hypothetical protein
VKGGTHARPNNSCTCRAERSQHSAAAPSLFVVHESSANQSGAVTMPKAMRCRSQPLPTKKQFYVCRLDLSCEPASIRAANVLCFARLQVLGQAAAFHLPSVARCTAPPVHRFWLLSAHARKVCSGTHSLPSDAQHSAALALRYAALRCTAPASRRAHSTKQNHAPTDLPHAARRE